MQANVEGEVLVAARTVDFAHLLAHLHRGTNGAVGSWERRHHRVTDGLDDRAAFRRDRSQQRAEMVTDEVESGQVAHAIVERRRAHEVGEQDRQIGDPEPLLGIEGGVAVEIAEGLVA